jgi:hypothetical protein
MGEGVISMLSICGLECDKCRAFNTVCKGCQPENGKPFWTKDEGKRFCEMFSCCVYKKKLNHCGECAEVPCRYFRQFKDPLLTKEEAEKALEARVQRLRDAVANIPENTSGQEEEK